MSLVSGRWAPLGDGATWMEVVADAADAAVSRFCGRTAAGAAPSRNTTAVAGTGDGVEATAFAVSTAGGVGAGAGANAACVGAGPGAAALGWAASAGVGLPRVTYQMPAARTTAATPPSSGNADARRVPRPMTTGAIEAAVLDAGGVGTLAWGDAEENAGPWSTTRRSSASRVRSRASFSGSSRCCCASSSTAIGFSSNVSTRRCPSESPWLGVASSASPAEVRALRVEESKAIVFLGESGCRCEQFGGGW